MLKIHDNPNLRYNNGIILNEDDKGYHEYIANRNRMQRQMEVDLAMKERINSLEEELSQMKKMLRMMLDNKGT